LSAILRRVCTRPRSSSRQNDTGTPIIDLKGAQIGIVADVSGDTVHVDPDPGLVEDLQATLGWDDADDEYTIDASALERTSRGDVAVFRVRPDKLA
jgi:hypothetical protein